MPIDINVPDKILAGLNQSYTITSDSGEPSGSVTVGGQDVPHRIVSLGPPKEQTADDTPTFKYKVSFLLPGDSAGKKLQLEFSAGASKASDEHEIIADQAAR